ncbi:MAG: relaxase/mobilization nuclease domain-containing protein [Verrucomicrobiales bacterium]|jgi:hypothetical protein|nr:relaxase/mobilization nuclease domain-containing protein [Verrucomicrobiales bacterium]
MKAIVAVKPSPKRAKPLLAHCYRAHARTGDEMPCADRVTDIVHNLDGVALRQPSVDSRSLLAGHHGGCRPVRHVVISVEDCQGAARGEALRRLRFMVGEFVENFAIGAKYVAVIHQDRNHPHAHLVIGNSVNGRGIRWQRRDLRAMQEMRWTRYAQSGKRRESRGTTNVYPLAKNLDAQKIAVLDERKLNELIASGAIGIGRRDKNGGIQSITFNGRRIWLATIRRLSVYRERLAGGEAGVVCAGSPALPDCTAERRTRRGRLSRSVAAGTAVSKRGRGTFAWDKVHPLEGTPRMVRFDGREVATQVQARKFGGLQL